MKEQYALQMFSLRDATKADAAGTLKKVAAMGFKSLELCGYYGYAPAQMKELLDSLGLKAISAHIGYEGFTGNFADHVEMNHAVGNETVILPYYGFPDIEACKRAQEPIARMMNAFKAEGFRFGYHNHKFEFMPLDDKGTCPIDFLKEIDGLMFQPDMFWIKTAGSDPIGFLKENPGRILSVHMKEYREDGFNVEFGNGILPWAEIMQEAQKAGTEIGILEQEQYTCDPIDSVAICAQNIEKIFGK